MDIHWHWTDTVTVSSVSEETQALTPQRQCPTMLPHALRPSAITPPPAS